MMILWGLWAVTYTAAWYYGTRGATAYVRGDAGASTGLSDRARLWLIVSTACGALAVVKGP